MAMMTELKTFISATGSEIVRASRNGDGDWKVLTLLSDKGVTCLADDPGNPGIIYAGTQKQGVWRSDDAGLTWKASGLDGQCIKSLAVNKHNSNVVYAGTKPALMFISSDGAQTWRELESFRQIPNRWWWFSPAEPPDFRPYVMAIAPSPTEPDLLLAGIEFGAVVRSEDNGLSWSSHIHGALRDCHSLKFHATDGKWVYQAGGSGGGAAVSPDLGYSFLKKREGLSKHYGIVCASDPVDPEVWYICVASSPFKAYGKFPETYLFRSDGHSGWKPIGWAPHPLHSSPTALVTIRDTPGHLYAGLMNGEVWQSCDYGDSWRRLPFNLKRIWHSLLIN
jgi:hypothetical protein